MDFNPHNPLPPELAAAVGEVLANLFGGIDAIYYALTGRHVRLREVPSGSPDDGDEYEQAAIIIGVELDATEAEIRAALRQQLRETQLHPDHGGDADGAKSLVAAQNLLIERARRRAGGDE
jgi:hypothetical protein